MSVLVKYKNHVDTDTGSPRRRLSDDGVSTCCGVSWHDVRNGG